MSWRISFLDLLQMRAIRMMSLEVVRWVNLSLSQPFTHCRIGLSGWSSMWLRRWDHFSVHYNFLWAPELWWFPFYCWLPPSGPYCHFLVRLFCFYFTGIFKSLTGLSRGYPIISYFIFTIFIIPHYSIRNLIRKAHIYLHKLYILVSYVRQVWYNDCLHFM